MKNSIAILFVFLSLGCSAPPLPTEAQLREVLELGAAEMRIREIISYQSSDRLLFIPYNQNQLLFSIEYRIRAGIAELGELKWDILGAQRLHITLPPVQILTIDALEETIEDLLGDNEALGVNHFQGILEAHKNTIRARAKEYGLLAQGEKQIRSLLSTWFSTLGYSQVEIRFLEPEGES